MQRINLIKHAVNLKYGLGVELNNYFFDDTRVRFSKNPTKVTHRSRLLKMQKRINWQQIISRVPMMLNFNFTPDKTYKIVWHLAQG